MAEVEAVIRTFVHRFELLETLYSSHDAGYPAVLVVLDSGVLRVASHLDLVLFSHRDNARQEVFDALPHGVGICCTTFELRQRLIQIRVFERRQRRAASPIARRGSQVTEDRDVVEQSSYTSLRRHTNDLA